MGEIEQKYSKKGLLFIGFVMTSAIIILGFTTVYSNVFVEAEEKYSYIIPEWVKANAGWWSEGEITDEEFSYSLQWLFDHGLVDVQKCTGRCM